jgi:hypothetical protein
MYAAIIELMFRADKGLTWRNLTPNLFPNREEEFEIKPSGIRSPDD